MFIKSCCTCSSVKRCKRNYSPTPLRCKANIREVMERIPNEQRMVIELAYFGGLTHAEIAEQYHIPLGTVKGRMRLGLQKMKALLAKRGLGVI